MIIAGNKWLKKSKSSFPGVTLGKKGNRMLVEAVNQIGFEVQKFDGTVNGWIPAVTEEVNGKWVPMVLATRGLADQVMDHLADMSPKREFRVYAALIQKERR